jgi:hypothetical protein
VVFPAWLATARVMEAPPNQAPLVWAPPEKLRRKLINWVLTAAFTAGWEGLGKSAPWVGRQEARQRIPKSPRLRWGFAFSKWKRYIFLRNNG